MAKIIFNEDPNHFMFTRERAGMREITEEYARDFIRQYSGSGITDFMACLGASSPWYKSKRVPGIIDKYLEWDAMGKADGSVGVRADIPEVVTCAKLLSDYYNNHGENIQSVWIDELRKINISPWISIRMNDIHDAADKGAFLHSKFYDEHQDCLRSSYREPTGYFDYALDFMKEEVRSYYKEILTDALETFDPDGVELDWMREIYSARIGGETEAISVLTSYMEELCAIINDAGKRYGHRIKVGVRMPHSIEKALRLGFDILDWVDKGLVDLLVVTPRWSSTDNNLPIDVWKRVLKGKDVELAAGLEILYDSFNRRKRVYKYNTYETAIGSAYAYTQMGADGIYLFNYMDAVEKTDGLSLICDKDKYNRFLSIAGNDEEAAKENRRHVVTFTDVYAPGSDISRMLPLTVSERNGGFGDFASVRIPTGAISGDAEVSLVIGLAPEDAYKAENLTVYAQAKKCGFAGKTETPENACEDYVYFRYTIENDGKLSPATVAEFGIKKGSVTVYWAELDVSFNK